MSRIVPLLLLFATVAGCKFPLAAAYRTHSLLVTARDGAGETLARVQRAEMVECEAQHRAPATSWKADLKKCYQRVREPVAIWVRHVRPAITAALSALWFALETYYVVDKQDTPAAKKARAIACAKLQAAETTLKQYAGQLGKLGTLKDTIIGGVAAGKALVCDG